MTDSMEDRYGLLRELAREFHVETLSVRGAYGLISGPASDNVIMRWYATTGTWSAPTNEMIAERLRSGGTFVDVGANLGLTTIPAARLPGVRVISFEPDPTCYRYLVDNVAANCPNADVRLENLAIYDREAVLTLEVSNVNHGDNRIRRQAAAGALDEQDRPTVPVRAVPLDDFLTDPLVGPVVVKVDTQGAEPYVVAGGRRTLAQATLVLLEYWPYGMARQQGDPSILHDVMKQFPKVAVRTETGETHVMTPDEAIARVTALDASDPEAYVDVILSRD